MTYIVWTQADRASVLKAFVNMRMNSNEIELTLAWVRRNWLAAQSLLPQERKRRSNTPKELAEVMAHLKDIRIAGSFKAAPAAEEFHSVAGHLMTTEEAVAFAKRWGFLVMQAQLHEQAHGAKMVDDAIAYRKRLVPTGVATLMNYMPANKAAEEIVGNPVALPVGQLVRLATQVPEKRRPVVVIAGVHGKHRSDLEAQFQSIKIIWVEPGDHDRSLRTKCSARHVICFNHGVNGTVMRVIKSISADNTFVEGMSGVKAALQQFHSKQPA